MRFDIRSQDIGLIALVRLGSCGETLNAPSLLLRKEKDEASPPICFRRDSLMPSFSILRKMKAFLYRDEVRRSRSANDFPSHFQLHTSHFLFRAGLSETKPVPLSPAELSRKISMKKLRSQIRSLSLAVASLFVLNSSPAASFDDVQYWVGSGANKAAFVIDWNDGKAAESLLWGYRWDGSATGLDMFQAVVNSDARLFGRLGVYSFGTAVMGMGYDLNGHGSFGVSPAISFDSGGLTINPANASNFSDARVAVEAADHYVEGWNSGYWSYYVKPSTAADWDYAPSGAALRVLSDGVWDGWSFSPGFVDSIPSEPLAAAPVPEPSALALLSASALFLTCARRKH